MGAEKAEFHFFEYQEKTLSPYPRIDMKQDDSDASVLKLDLTLGDLVQAVTGAAATIYAAPEQPQDGSGRDEQIRRAVETALAITTRAMAELRKLPALQKRAQPSSQVEQPDPMPMIDGLPREKAEEALRSLIEASRSNKDRDAGNRNDDDDEDD